jgi:Na+/H+ antiporter NhaD/arsenite permease-like protein
MNFFPRYLEKSDDTGSSSIGLINLQGAPGQEYRHARGGVRVRRSGSRTQFYCFWAFFFLLIAQAAFGQTETATSARLDQPEISLAPDATASVDFPLALPLSKMRLAVLENGQTLPEQEVRHQFRFVQDPKQKDRILVTNLTAEPKTIRIAAAPNAVIDRLPQILSLVLVALLLLTFVAMTFFEAPIPLAMALLACTFLATSWEQADIIIGGAFRNFSEIAIVFTAVAVPAHMIERSHGFEWIAAVLGNRFGHLRLKKPRLATPLLVGVLLAGTFVVAALMHNVTSILIMTPIIIRVCDSYGIPSRWVLCAALVASNLGGFSTAWGDTPNIVEAREWRLQPGDFFVEILPPNLLVLAALIGVATFLTQRTLAKNQATASQTEFSVGGHRKAGPTLMTALGAAGWEEERRNISVDSRLLGIGLGALAGFIALHVIWHELSLALGAITILLCVLLERPRNRYTTLTSLGFEVYLTFAAIFIIAACIKNSWAGYSLQQLIEEMHFAPWIISVTACFGTLFTEAGSWVNAVAEDIASGDASHRTAWALGAGICAGSSSILTAASAGIILWEQSGRFKEHAISFRAYIPFGLGFALFMLVFYSTYFTFFFH